jgi:predicted phage tail protein
MMIDGVQKLVNVHLYPPLSDKFGALHKFAIRSPHEAVRALDANYPEFVSEFRKCDRYVILVDDNEVRAGPEEFMLPVSHDIHLIPRIEGQAFLGPMAVGAVLGIAATSITAQILGTLLVAGVLFGLSMLFRPKKPEKPATEEAKKDDSFAFSGPENVTAQGVAVPLIYGRVFAGSVVVSAGLSVSDVAIT